MPMGPLCMIWIVIKYIMVRRKNLLIQRTECELMLQRIQQALQSTTFHPVDGAFRSQRMIHLEMKVSFQMEFVGIFLKSLQRG